MLEVGDKKMKEGDGAVERAVRGFDGPFLREL